MAPSLADWFNHWLDGMWREQLTGRDALAPEHIETVDVLDPDSVWHGLYRFGPNWVLRPDGTIPTWWSSEDAGEISDD